MRSFTFRVIETINYCDRIIRQLRKYDGFIWLVYNKFITR